MFNYKLLIVLIIITISSSIPVRKSLLNEPQRCCAPKQYSLKIGLSYGITLPDGMLYGSYVIYSNHIFIEEFFASYFIFKGSLQFFI